MADGLQTVWRYCTHIETGAPITAAITIAQDGVAPSSQLSFAKEEAAAISMLLRVARHHLGMDVALLSRFDGDYRQIVMVEAEDGAPAQKVGNASPLGETYCHHVATGRLPKLIPDAHKNAFAVSLDTTRTLDIRTHVSVPVVLSDGTVYGALSCFSRRLLPEVKGQDVALVENLAELVAAQVQDHVRAERSESRLRDHMSVLRHRAGLRLVYQPIVDLITEHPIGFEALSRFPSLGEGPADVYSDAERLGLGRDLEIMALEAALEQIHVLPQETFLAVNLSPSTVVDRDVAACVAASGVGDRLVFEITEHAAVDDYEVLLPELGELSDLGVRLAVDDVGAGVSGLQQILRLDPSILKLDGGLVSDIDTAGAKRDLMTAMMSYAARSGAMIIAERVETKAEASALRMLGVHAAQGFYFGRPTPVPGTDTAGAAHRAKPPNGVLPPPVAS